MPIGDTPVQYNYIRNGSKQLFKTIIGLALTLFIFAVCVSALATLDYEANLKPQNLATESKLASLKTSKPDVVITGKIVEAVYKPVAAKRVSVQELPASLNVRTLIINAAIKYGVSPDYLLRIATCESGLRPNAVNRGYTAGGGHPSGLFQFLPSTWARMSLQAGYAGRSVFDPYANANVAAWAFAHGQAHQWECKG